MGGLTLAIKLERMTPTATLPSRSHEDDAGWDLYVDEDRWLWPLQGANLTTGWRVKLPVGHWGSIKSRSSTFVKRRIKVYEGVVDPGYTGPLNIIIQNMSLMPKRIRRGDRLAQLVVVQQIRTELWAVDVSLDTEIHTRGPRGFGSSGR